MCGGVRPSVVSLYSLPVGDDAFAVWHFKQDCQLLGREEVVSLCYSDGTGKEMGKD